MQDHAWIVGVLEDITAQSEQNEIKKIIASLVAAEAAKGMRLDADGTTTVTQCEGMSA